MKYNSIEAFVPSGSDFQASRSLFLELGFNIVWEADDYVGFENNGCKFILQKNDSKEFAENFMMSVKVDDLGKRRRTFFKNKVALVSEEVYAFICGHRFEPRLPFWVLFKFSVLPLQCTSREND